MIHDSTEFDLVVREWMWYTFVLNESPFLVYIYFETTSPSAWFWLHPCMMSAPLLEGLLYQLETSNVFYLVTCKRRCVLYGRDVFCMGHYHARFTLKIQTREWHMRTYLPVFLSIQFRNKDICPGLICMIRPTFYSKCSLFYCVVCLSFFFWLSYRNCKGLSRLTILSNLSLGVLLTLRVSVFSADWIFSRALVLLNSTHTHTHTHG